MQRPHFNAARFSRPARAFCPTPHRPSASEARRCREPGAVRTSGKQRTQRMATHHASKHAPHAPHAAGSCHPCTMPHATTAQQPCNHTHRLHACNALEAHGVMCMLHALATQRMRRSSPHSAWFGVQCTSRQPSKRLGLPAQGPVPLPTIPTNQGYAVLCSSALIIFLHECQHVPTNVPSRNAACPC